MDAITGQAVSPGVASGNIHLLRPAPLPSSVPLPIEQELSRFHLARQEAAGRLVRLERQALEQAGREGADIFHIHAMLLEDPDLTAAAEKLIRSGLSAGEAVLRAGQRFSAAFAALEDDYLRARAEDVEAVTRRVARIIEGGDPNLLPLDHPILLAADSLSPADLLTWGRERLLGVILKRCSPSGHTAILARALGLPVLSGLAPEACWQGRAALLDAGAGRLYLDPEPGLLAQAKRERRAARRSQEHLRALAQLPAVTLDGRPVPLLANVGSAAEAALALEQGAVGVGLLRSEFLFLNRATCPDEEEQFSLYRQVVQMMEGRPVVIRTLDAGGDKPLPYLDLPQEDNPALGLRGIRLSLVQEDLFCTQLRAILRASALGPVSVLFPMIASRWEVRRAKALLERCRAQLEEQGIETGPLPVGVMIETPAAALTADGLALEADFFSLGTNDLAQYTLAADRQDPNVGRYYDPRHPAVLSLIQMAAQAAHRQGKRVTLCGELGADLEMTAALLALGVDELSVSPSTLLPLRRHVRDLDLGKAAFEKSGLGG